jgi:hypothetical protein
MSGITRRALPAQAGAGLLILLAALRSWWRGAGRDAAMGCRTIEGLVALLRRRGLAFRAVPAAKGGALNGGAYLTTTEKPWAVLNGLSRTPERVDDWRGTVHCGRLYGKEDAAVRLFEGGDCVMHIGHWIFFGDPSLLARIRDALRA